VGFWAQTLNIFVFWVGLFPQWEVQEVASPFTDNRDVILALNFPSHSPVEVTIMKLGIFPEI